MFIALVAVAGANACSGSSPPIATPPDVSGVGVPVSIVTSAISGERMTPGDPEARFAEPPTTGTADARFEIIDTIEHQRIDGFGASFLEAGLVTLNTLPTREEQQRVLRALFDPVDGAGFTIMKTVIGACDFQSASPEWYTYDDVPGDVTLENFSIARDLGPNGLVTYIRRAREAGGVFRLQAPMDFPPDWMITNIDVEGSQNVDPRYYDVLAQYYVKYVRAYEAEGIHIDYVSLFNEPIGYTDIPIGDIHVLLRDHVGPAFEREALATGIMLSEVVGHTWAAEWYPSVMDDPEARRHVDVMGYHDYDALWGHVGEVDYDAMQRLADRYPEVPLWMTEACCDPVVPTFAFEDAPLYGDMILNDFESGTSAWLYWNMILDETGGPWLVSPIHGDPDGNVQPALVTIDKSTHAVTYTGVFWYLAHFSKFVRPDARRIETAPQREAGVRAISFRNADGTIVTELLHDGVAPVVVEVAWRGGVVRIELPAISITTLRYRP